MQNTHRTFWKLGRKPKGYLEKWIGGVLFELLFFRVPWAKQTLKERSGNANFCVQHYTIIFYTFEPGKKLFRSPSSCAIYTVLQLHCKLSHHFIRTTTIQIEWKQIRIIYLWVVTYFLRIFNFQHTIIHRWKRCFVLSDGNKLKRLATQQISCIFWKPLNRKRPYFSGEAKKWLQPLFSTFETFLWLTSKIRHISCRISGSTIIISLDPSEIH